MKKRRLKKAITKLLSSASEWGSMANITRRELRAMESYMYRFARRIEPIASQQPVILKGILGPDKKVIPILNLGGFTRAGQKEMYETARIAEIQICHPNRQVAKTQLDNCRVSTVFLTINSGFRGEPLWFETMVFGGPHDGYCDRYPTYKEAIVGHEKAVRMIKENIVPLKEAQ